MELRMYVRPCVCACAHVVCGVSAGTRTRTDAQTNDRQQAEDNPRFGRRLVEVPVGEQVRPDAAEHPINGTRHTCGQPRVEEAGDSLREDGCGDVNRRCALEAKRDLYSSAQLVQTPKIGEQVDETHVH